MNNDGSLTLIAYNSGIYKPKTMGTFQKMMREMEVDKSLRHVSEKFIDKGI